MRSRQRGFTLVELLIALAIVGALLAVAFGGLRVALAAWTKGEDRAEAHQHTRGVALTLARALAGAYPYRAAVGPAPDPVILFTGTDGRVEFVTQAAPFPSSAPIAFTAVVIGLESEEGGPALVVRERPLPNRDPFTEARVVLRDPSVPSVTFQYLGAGGSWQDSWNGENEKSLPRAIRLSVSTVHGARTETMPALTISLWAVTP